jgi:phosphatidylglycerol:prolipoprotein diacylglycerol transferase
MYPRIEFELFGHPQSLATWNLAVGLGMVLAFLLLEKLSREAFDDRQERDAVFWAAVSGLFAGFPCAWLFDGLVRGGSLSLKQMVFHEPLAGFTFLGGLLGGTAVALTILYKRKVEIITALGVLAPPLTMAHAVGRIGCFLAGCCYGKEIYLLGHPFRLPTQLIESGFLFLLTLVLVRIEVSKRFTVYLVAYGVFRFLIELIRDDTRGSMLLPMLSPSQHLSFLMMLVGVGFVLVSHLRPRTIFFIRRSNYNENSI